MSKYRCFVRYNERINTMTKPKKSPPQDPPLTDNEIVTVILPIINQ